MSISDRTAAIVGGTALVIHGALKRGPLGTVAIGVGGVIAYLGLRYAPQPKPSGRQLLRASHTMESEPFEAFTHWQDLSRLSSVFGDLRTVKQLDNGNWRIPVPGLGHWEVEITNQQPGHVIEWRSVTGSPVEGRGIIRFTRKKNGRGTKVHHEISYMGAGAANASAKTEPALQTA